MHRLCWSWGGGDQAGRDTLGSVDDDIDRAVLVLNAGVDSRLCPFHQDALRNFTRRACLS
jgi:hypothetical protein